jgi:hypothetical protein
VPAQRALAAWTRQGEGFLSPDGSQSFADIDWDGVAKALVRGFFLKSVGADNLAQQTFVLQRLT